MAVHSETTIERRRRAVGKQMLMMAAPTSRQIAAELAKEGELNPQSEQPWDHSTVARDMEHIRGEWRQEVLKPLVYHRNRMAHSYALLLETAWRGKNLSEIRQTLRDYIEFLQLNGATIVVAQHLEAELQDIFDKLEIEFLDTPEIMDRVYRALAPELN